MGLNNTTKDPARDRYLRLVQQSVLGALDTSVPDRGWENTRAHNGFLRGVPGSARTMIGRPRLDNLRALIETVVAEQIEGDLIELGSWRCGAGIFMKACLVALDDTERTLYLADTFSSPQDVAPPGLFQRLSTPVIMWALPHLSEKNQRKVIAAIFQNDFPEEDYTPETTAFVVRNLLDIYRNPTPPVAVDDEDAREAFRRYGLLDDRVVLLKGWFSDTLPTAPLTRIAILRLDGDFYRSTMDGLTNLYDKLSPGGFCIVDDYGAFPECRRAVDEYRAAHGIDAPLEVVDEECVVWRVPLPASDSEQG